MNARALIVDDEADIRELLSLTLNRMGLATDSAESEFEARRLLQKHHYDLCLTDMRLPDGDGLALLEYTSRFWPQMPVAVITAFGSAENAVASLKAGAFDYLPKRSERSGRTRSTNSSAVRSAACSAAAPSEATGTITRTSEPSLRLCRMASTTV